MGQKTSFSASSPAKAHLWFYVGPIRATLSETLVGLLVYTNYEKHQSKSNIMVIRRIQRVGGRGSGPFPPGNLKATKPAFNVGPSSASQRNTIENAFRWRSDDDPFIPPPPKKNKKKQKKPPLTFFNFLDLAHQSWVVSDFAQL